MNYIEILKTRRENKKLAKRLYYLKKGECCETCKYCSISLRAMFSISDYEYYKCKLKEVGFIGNDNHIDCFKCKNYDPCRKKVKNDKHL